MKSKTKTFFITGTGTDIGKTIAVAGMAAVCTNAGLNTAVMKPIQTGTVNDLGDLHTIHNLVPGLSHFPADLVSPYSFKLPASPHLAAETENSKIDPEKIKKSITDIYEKSPDILLIEGAGGVMVPITYDYTFLDMLKELQISVIITALAGLGTINHTLLTVDALTQAQIPIAGIIINKMPLHPGIIENNNLITIEKFAKTPILGIIHELDKTKTDFHIVLYQEFKKQEKLLKLLL